MMVEKNWVTKKDFPVKLRYLWLDFERIINYYLGDDSIHGVYLRTQNGEEVELKGGKINLLRPEGIVIEVYFSSNWRGIYKILKADMNTLEIEYTEQIQRM